MGLLQRIGNLFGRSSRASDEQLDTLLAGFDEYSQKFILGVDPRWDASTRMHNVEYCLCMARCSPSFEAAGEKPPTQSSFCYHTFLDSWIGNFLRAGCLNARLSWASPADYKACMRRVAIQHKPFYWPEIKVAQRILIARRICSS